jgi:CheY-like chemotaxis protein
MDAFDERVTRWRDDASHLLELVSRLVEDRDRLAAIAGSAAAESRRLETALESAQAEIDALRKMQADVADLLASGVDRANEQLRRFHASAAGKKPGTAPPIEADASPVVPQPADEPASALAGGARRRRILLVDDDAPARAMLAEYLMAHRGYEVVTAVTGEAALEILQGLRPDLVLLDVVMPGVGGLETLRRIKRLYPAVTVLMISASTDLTIARQALAQGAADYLVKPCDLDYLDAALTIHIAADDSAAEARPEAD